MKKSTIAAEFQSQFNNITSRSKQDPAFRLGSWINPVQYNEFQIHFSEIGVDQQSRVACGHHQM
jgi:hypothetical protein